VVYETYRFKDNVNVKYDFKIKEGKISITYYADRDIEYYPDIEITGYSLYSSDMVVNVINYYILTDSVGTLLFPLLFLENPFKEYIYEDGKGSSVKLSNDKISFSDKILFNIKDYPFNGEYKYEEIKKTGITFIQYGKQKNLMLRSEDYIMLFDEKKNMIFKGFTQPERYSNKNEIAVAAKKYNPSSELKEKGKIYEANNLSILRLNNPWVEGISGSGIGQYVEMEWENPVAALLLINGFVSYDKPELYENNNRTKRIRIYTETEKGWAEFDMEDSANPQIVKLKKSAKKIKLEIADIYRGSKWDDTCISMVLGIE
jgi:hypothetical protein